jgi:thioredoxin reductase (NADPH)
MSYDVIIIGSGAAGLSSGLYAGRYLMKALVIGKEFGGETARAGTIWNYPGAANVDGYELMKIMREQGKSVGTEFIDGEVSSIENLDGCFRVYVKEKIFDTNTIIFASGSARRRLGLTDEERLTSKGVHYCVTCDGPLYTGKRIAMVGGGDASVKSAITMGTYASHIYVIVRGDNFSAEPVNVEALKALGDKVTILFGTEVRGLVGKDHLEKIILSKPHHDSPELSLDGLFIEIGATPNAILPKSLGVHLDEKGYVAVDNDMKTNVPGVFAAGDATNHFGFFKQDITAAAMGAVAATSAYQHRKLRGDLCEVHWRPEVTTTTPL